MRRGCGAEDGPWAARRPRRPQAALEIVEKVLTGWGNS
jgi:hypothetical protein